MSDILQTAIMNLARESRSWESLELHTQTEIIYLIPLDLPGGEPSNGKTSHYIETNHGERLMVEQFNPKEGSVSRMEGYSDGTKCCEILEGRKGGRPEVRIGTSFMSEGMTGNTRRPNCLIYWYVGKVPIDEALANAKPLGTGKVIERDVDFFLFPRVRWGMMEQDLVYSLDRETSIPIKVESFKNEEARATNQPGWTWTARKLDFIQGHPIVVSSEHHSFTTERPGNPRELYLKESEVVKTAEFNAKFPPSTFWPIMSNDAIVVDSINKKVTLPPAQAKPASSTIATQPIRVDPSSDWTGAASGLLLALGVASIVGGLGLKFRR